MNYEEAALTLAFEEPTNQISRSVHNVEEYIDKGGRFRTGHGVRDRFVWTKMLNPRHFTKIIIIIITIITIIIIIIITIITIIIIIIITIIIIIITIITIIIIITIITIIIIIIIIIVIITIIIIIIIIVIITNCPAFLAARDLLHDHGGVCYRLVAGCIRYTSVDPPTRIKMALGYN